MPYVRPHIEIEGLREWQAAVKRQLGELPKSLGQAHKNVGQFVIDKLPAGAAGAVGAGTGSAVRASATKREVVLRAGSGVRVSRAQERHVPTYWDQWGRRQVQPFVKGRPHIVGTIESNQDEIEQEFMEQIIKALAPAFWRAE